MLRFRCCQLRFFRKSCRNSSQSARSPTLPAAQKKDAQEAYKLLQGLYQAHQGGPLPGGAPGDLGGGELANHQRRRSVPAIQRGRDLLVEHFQGARRRGRASPRDPRARDRDRRRVQHGGRAEAPLCRPPRLRRGGANSDEESTPTDPPASAHPPALPSFDREMQAGQKGMSAGGEGIDKVVRCHVACSHPALVIRLFSLDFGCRSPEVPNSQNPLQEKQREKEELGRERVSE